MCVTQLFKTLSQLTIRFYDRLGKEFHILCFVLPCHQKYELHCNSWKAVSIQLDI